MDLKNKKAFTLAEMMVVLLVISLAMAAFTPVMTRRTKAAGGTSNPWLWAENKIDAVFNEGATAGAIIGATEFAAGENSRMLINTTDASQNNIIFKQANVTSGLLHIDGSGNTGLGSVSFDATTPTVTGVTLMGSSAQVSSTASGATVLGEAANATGFRGVSIGSGATTSGSSGIAIGAKGNNYGTDTFTEASGQNAVAIGRTTKATGNYATAIGNQVVSSGIGSIAIGYATTPGSATTASGDSSIAMGINAKATVDSAIAIGTGAKSNGFENVAIGHATLTSNADFTGQMQNGMPLYSARNIGVGGYALNANTSGSDNIALGYYALVANTTAFNNTAIGSGSLMRNTSGKQNSALGGGALLYNTTGENNTSLGYLTLYDNVTGSNNTAIGSGACADVTGSNKTCIGAGSGPDASHAFFDTDNVERIFIGKPSYRIMWKDDTWFGDTVMRHALGGNSAIVEIHNNETPTSDDSATVVINANLVVRGQMFYTDEKYRQRHINTDNSANTQETVKGSSIDDFWFYGSWNSDRRLKNIGTDFTSSLDKLRELKAFNYTFKKDKNKTPRVGVMAQDLQKVIPNAVKKAKSGYLQIRMEDMFYTMMNSIKELDVIVQGLTKDVKSLIERVQSIEGKIVALINVNQTNNKRIKELQYKNALLEKQNKNFEARLRKLENR